MSYKDNTRRRLNASLRWRIVFSLSTIFAIFILTVLMLTIINGAFGLVAIQNKIEPVELVASGDLTDLTESEMIEILEENLSKGLIRRFNSEEPLVDRSKAELVVLVGERIIEPTIIRSWNLFPSIFQREEIVTRAMSDFPDAVIEFRAWLNPRFLVQPQASTPQFAGIRTAFLGTLWVISITIIFAFPIGVGSAIYLEEYAKDNRLNRLIQVNIYNLSGVPSIIYGLLGLAVFVRILEPLTTGRIFGVEGAANGRTILSAGLTLGLLILPMIIIAAQEAIRAVPQSMREASYGLGGTKWQTIWSHVLPASMDRILTGTILSVSRAIGETAPIVVIGASTFISVDPTGPFSKFTTLPIQIYQWTARPQAAFRNVAAAAIIVLLILLISMNAFAISMRNKISKNRRGQ